MRRFITVFALALSACSSSSSAPVPPADAGSDAPVRPAECLDQDAKVQQALDGARTSVNAAVGVANATCGRSLYVSGDAASATPDSLWRIGSVTKTFVSAVILTLVRDGKLTLADPLATWVPGVPSTDGVTVRMLMNHTSGIFNYTETNGFFVDRKRKWTPQEIVDLATQNPPYFAPGAGFHYSNTNYVLLAMIAEKATGAKIGSLVRARVIEPAKAPAIFFDGEEAVGGTMARGFAKNGKTDVTFISDPSGPWAAGAIVARPDDLAGYARALYGSDAILDAPRKALLTASPVAKGQYGLGVEILDGTATGGVGPALGHGGDIDGFHTQAFYLVDKDTAVVAIVNQDGIDPNDVLAAAIKALF